MQLIPQSSTNADSDSEIALMDISNEGRAACRAIAQPGQWPSNTDDALGSSQASGEQIPLPGGNSDNVQSDSSLSAMDTSTASAAAANGGGSGSKAGFMLETPGGAGGRPTYRDDVRFSFSF